MTCFKLRELGPGLRGASPLFPRIPHRIEQTALVSPCVVFALVSCFAIFRRSFDREQNGTIEKSELVDALKGMFPVEPGALEEVIEMNWRSWDADGNGTLGTVSQH